MEWTLEAVLGAIAGVTDAAWVQRFSERYLAFGRVDDACMAAAP